ncbi:MAG: hypothetical protein KF852_01265 [Saprospiraceae bacterium]|nr:hypothetical protein [Saprospiraceae bacterium]
MLLFAFFLLMLSGCRNDTSGSGAQADAAAAAGIHPGKKLMETNCYLCHSPAAPEQEGRIGPPMVAIKAYYMEGGVGIAAARRHRTILLPHRHQHDVPAMSRQIRRHAAGAASKDCPLYPGDLATGYAENEVRGIWSIRFKIAEPLLAP